MPSTSKKQHNFMAMIANDPKKAKQLGVPQSVGKEFTEADKGKKFGTGERPDLQKANKKKTDHGQTTLFKEGGKVMKHDDMKQDKPMMKQIAGVEATKVVNKHEKKMHGMCGGGKVKKMSAGGKARGCGIAIKGKTKGKIC
jgi:hypothetical protein